MRRKRPALVLIPVASYSSRARCMPRDGLRAVAAPGDQFSEQRIVFVGHGPAGIDAVVQANARTGRQRGSRESSRATGKNCCPDPRHRCGIRWRGRATATSCCANGNCLAGGDANLQLHQVERGDHLRSPDAPPAGACSSRENKTGGPASTRNSTVPALVYAPARASLTAASPMARRSSAS